MSATPSSSRHEHPPVLPPLTPMAWLRNDLINSYLEGLQSTSKVLEVGAGRGALATRLAHRFSYTGIEADPVSAQVAIQSLKSCGAAHEFHSNHFEEAELDEDYDAVCAFEVLEHIDDDVGAVRAWSELLRPGGRVVLSVPAWQHRYGPWDARVGHFRRYDPADLEGVLRRAGLEDVRTGLYGFPLAYALEAGRNAVARRRPAPGQQHATAESGRLLQPASPRWSSATDMLTRPFRLLQKWIGPDRWGIGLVGVAFRRT